MATFDYLFNDNNIIFKRGNRYNNVTVINLYCVLLKYDNLKNSAPRQ